MEETHRNKPWTTKCEWIDADTGEVLTAREAKKHYITIKIEKKHEQNEQYNVKRYTYICERDKQQKLW